MADRPRRRWRNFLLARGVQLHYAVSVTVLSAAVAGTLGLVIYRQSAFASEHLVAALAAPEMAWLDVALRDEILAGLVRADLGLLGWMVGLGVVLALGLLGGLVVMTHRVAGPLYRMARTLEGLGQGDLAPPAPLRKGDRLTDLFAVLCAAHATQRRRAEEDVAAMDALLQGVESTGGARSAELAQALGELAALRDATRRRLGEPS